MRKKVPLIQTATVVDYYRLSTLWTGTPSIIFGMPSVLPIGQTQIFG